jgi:hypothetical protein
MDTTSLTEVLETVFGVQLAAFQTSLPARVVSYDPATQKARVQPTVKVWLPTADEAVDVEESLPDLIVPVLPMRGGGFYIHMPLAPGDRVTVLVHDVDWGEWYAYGAIRGGDDRRLHDLAHSVAIPMGLSPKAQVLSGLGANLELGKEGGLKVEIAPSQMNVGGSSDAAARASVMDTAFTNIKIALDAIALAAGASHAFVPPTDVASAKLKLGG